MNAQIKKEWVYEIVKEVFIDYFKTSGLSLKDMGMESLEALIVMEDLEKKLDITLSDAETTIIYTNPILDGIRLLQEKTK